MLYLMRMSFRDPVVFLPLSEKEQMESKGIMKVRCVPA